MSLPTGLDSADVLLLEEVRIKGERLPRNEDERLRLEWLQRMVT